MCRPIEETKGIYRLPRNYFPAITKLIEQGQVDISNLTPSIRSALGRTAQQTGLFTYKKTSLIEANHRLEIIEVNDRYIKIQKQEEPRLETL